jgi:IS30 family transposase
MSYRHFSIEEREMIARGLSEGKTRSKIAKELGRHHSSVGDEIRRNSIDGTYWPSKAQALADQRKRDSKHPWKMTDDRIAERVKSGLVRNWSPEQIAGRMKLDFPSDDEMRICHGTIYAWIRREKRSGGNWHAHLRQSGRKRRKRYGTAEKRGRIPDRVDIDERPEIVDTKTRIGDWEGDTIEGVKGSGYLATMVDRRSKYLVLAWSNTKQSVEIRKAITRSFRRHGALPCETITLDNGREFADHVRLKEKLGADVYFAKPYHSWERGLNENTNGLLRQHFPKGMDFGKITQYRLTKIEAELNDRPRKSLDYRTPREIISQ